MIDEELYPESAKLSHISKESKTISEFLDWLRSETPYRFSEYVRESDNPYCQEFVLVEAYVNIETLLAEFFNIDLQKVSEEKDKMLKLMG